MAPGDAGGGGGTTVVLVLVTVGGWELPVLAVLGVEHDQDRDDDRQRAEHSGRPQQRALTGGERAPLRHGVRWLPVTGRGRAAVGGRLPKSAAARAWVTDGMAAGAARPMVGAWFGPGRPSAGTHRGHRIGERAAGPVPLARAPWPV